MTSKVSIKDCIYGWWQVCWLSRCY